MVQDYRGWTFRAPGYGWPWAPISTKLTLYSVRDGMIHASCALPIPNSTTRAGSQHRETKLSRTARSPKRSGGRGLLRRTLNRTYFGPNRTAALQTVGRTNRAGRQGAMFAPATPASIRGMPLGYPLWWGKNATGRARTHATSIYRRWTRLTGARRGDAGSERRFHACRTPTGRRP